MSVNAERFRQSTVYHVTITGRLDQALNTDLEQTLTGLLDAGHFELIVDLTETTYINSGGLRTLVSTWRKVSHQNGWLRLCGLSPRIQEIFSMVGFDQVFEIYPDCQELLKSK